MKIEIEIPDVPESEIIELVVTEITKRRSALIQEAADKFASQWRRENIGDNYYASTTVKNLVNKRMSDMLNEIVEQQAQRKDEVATFVFEKMKRNAETKLNKILKAQEDAT
jgi:predicted lipase